MVSAPRSASHSMAGSPAWRAAWSEVCAGDRLRLPRD
jgi:hypothetical protein